MKLVKKIVKKEKEIKSVVPKKSPVPHQDLVAHTVKHQKVQPHEQKIEETVAPKKIEKAPKPVEKKAPTHQKAQKMPSPAPKPAVEQPEMLEANDMFSGLGQDHFNEVMKL